MKIIVIVLAVVVLLLAMPAMASATVAEVRRIEGEIGRVDVLIASSDALATKAAQAGNAKAEGIARQAVAKARQAKAKLQERLRRARQPPLTDPMVVDLRNAGSPSLPAIGEETWVGMQKRMMKEREAYDARYRKTQKELLSLVPPVKGFQKVHEGVILGFGTDDNNAKNMLADGVSCFNGKAYKGMNDAADRARAEGKEGVGGAVIVSFGTPKGDQDEKGEKPVGYWGSEAMRVAGDHLHGGASSLASPQGQAALTEISGKAFDRLVAHSNGATVAEALIRDDRIRVNELNIVGGDMSLLRKGEYQALVDSGKVKRVVVWVNANDPVPGLTSVAPSNLLTAGNDMVESLTRKMVGNPPAGVEYRLMWGADHRIAAPLPPPGGMIDAAKRKADALIAPHFVESSYYPGIASFLGVDLTLPRRVLDGK